MTTKNIGPYKEVRGADGRVRLVEDKKAKLAGKIFGRLTVLRESGRKLSGHVIWLCACRCGAETSVGSTNLISGHTKSCGCLKAKPRATGCYPGARFGRLVILSIGEKSASKKTRWNCLCDCGATVLVHQAPLKRGETRSCGCLRREVHADYANKIRRQTADATIEDLLSYDPETGQFTWKVDQGKAKTGSLAGALNPRGYVSIGWGKKHYSAHRLAWYFVYGRWPRQHIDHINGNPRDNRISNLREATPAQNSANRIRNRNKSESAWKGVHKSSKNRWRAQIQVRGSVHYLGSFDSELAAAAAYEAAALIHHGEFASHLHRGGEA